MTTATLSHQRTRFDALYSRSSSDFNSDSPRKRRKYRPGGPGGGGLWRDVNAQPKPEHHTGTRRAPSRLAFGMVANASRTNSRPRREKSIAEQPTYHSAADAVAATAQVDGYKPREERSWEEFHPDLDLDAKISVYSAEAVDGPVLAADAKSSATPGLASSLVLTNGENPTNPFNIVPIITPPKRRPGRPPRRPESMLSGLGSPPVQRIVPLPSQNPRERLSLPKPVFRDVNVFAFYEQDKASQINYVNKTMEGLGYQKSDKFIRPTDTRLIRLAERATDEDKESLRLESDGGAPDAAGVRPLTQVEYDMDEQDQQWLDAYNAYRNQEGIETVKPAVLEVTMTQIEKEWHALERRIPKPNPKPPQTQRPRSSSAAAVNGEPSGQGEEQDSRCSICDDGDCENTNAIVFCDGCDLAVHQECYGVPYIPEGQWLCRKCQQVGRGTPTCIFCPNTEGAFKMTTESKWVHLVCAIWIPEVTIANMSFMEPITQVADVPKSRWKLNCYICNQRMGACIQCGNRNCFQAFHVTCARKAKLFLKMKSTHGGPAALDASVLKAYCDKHVPPEWRAEHDVDEATAQAKEFYRREMKGRRWADSQQSALSMMPTQQMHSAEAVEEFNTLDEARNANATPGQKRKLLQAQKDVWRLPSGAPVVPQVVLNAVESALQKFTLAKRKEFVAEACKYWSLKREARRGAALLKRLQLQNETFTTTELARRDFAAMGAAGGPKLQRRIEFSEQLDHEMSLLQNLCAKIKEREALKLADAELLRDVVDVTYFPTATFLWPVLYKARTLDQNLKFFTSGLSVLQEKLENRFYTSVSDFAADFGSIFRDVTGLGSIRTVMNEQRDPSAPSVRDTSLTGDQKEVLKLAKRIIKAVQQPLHDAARNEAELCQRSVEDEVRAVEMALDTHVHARDGASNMTEPKVEYGNATADDDGESSTYQSAKDTGIEETNGITPGVDGAIGSGSAHAANSDSASGIMDEAEDAQGYTNGISKRFVVESQGQQKSAASADDDSMPPRAANDGFLAAGGIGWYVEKFDIEGTTVHDERWEGRARAMSAQLSEMDEDELNELDADVADVTSKASKSVAAKKTSSTRKKKRTMYW